MLMKPSYRKISAAIGIALLIVSLLGIWHLTRGWIQAADVVDREFTSGGGVSRGAGAPAALYLENDSYYWLAYTIDVLSGERDWRAHYTTRDNPPDGRQMHWASLYMGLLILAGMITAAMTSLPLLHALEIGSCWVNPVLLASLVLGGSILVWRRFGALAAGLLAISLATLGDVGWTFQPLRPDHQSLHAFFAFFTVIFLVVGGLGWTRCSVGADRSGATVADREARWCFIFSAIAGGLGVWVSALVQSMVILAILFAVLGLAIFCPKDSALQSSYQPHLWRLWGWVGAGMSLMCYLVEYFPSQMRFGLEVNHPLYSASWLAVGELLYLITRWKCGGHPWTKVTTGAVITCGAVVLLIPGLIVFGPPSLHALRDGYMARLHNFIGEFYSYPAFSKGQMGSIFLKSDAVIALSLVLALFLAADRRVSVAVWSQLWFLFALTFFFMIIAYLQIRWLSIYSVLQCLLAAVCVGLALKNPARQRRYTLVGAGFAFVLGLQAIWLYCRQAEDLSLVVQKKNLPQELSDPAMQKQLALQLGRLRQGRPWRFLSDPNYAPSLQYFARIPSVVSFYWENRDGLHAATDFLADEASGEQALRIARERKLTHVLLPAGNVTSNFFYFVRHGSFSMERSADTLAGWLDQHWLGLPSWIDVDPNLQPIARQVFRYAGTPIEQTANIFKIEVDKASSH
jgi:hypothetical protein